MFDVVGIVVEFIVFFFFVIVFFFLFMGWDGFLVIEGRLEELGVEVICCELSEMLFVEGKYISLG